MILNTYWALLCSSTATEAPSCAATILHGLRGPPAGVWGRRRKAFFSETNLGKPTDKQKKKCVGEEWAPYWTQTPSEIMVKCPLAGRCRCEPWFLDEPARMRGFTLGHVACCRGLYRCTQVRAASFPLCLNTLS